MHAAGPVRAHGSRGDAPFDVIVLAGGRASRLGGVDKAALKLAGERLVDRVVRASRIAGASRIIVVGPESAGTGADVVLREDPEFAGPLAGIAAGIVEVTAAQVWVLACDLEYPERVCTVLGKDHARAQAEGRSAAEADGTLLVDSAGRAQWLAASYRSAAVAEACAGLGDGVLNAPVKRALAGLKLRELHVPAALAADIDTPESLAEARRRADQPG
ncbi:molybdopterin-guanine dinucleotide biosynthesis protein A [Leucobacter exalbidus]|uniref:Molybdopterin-guanine dinucleotide biosynthesis protein A n=1 Tax=Leucobacter exalbidus TaxID=662960 RepID=A0A940PTW8_9MICO|nr:NTP transferase domain-containing protein [Leucobacter exalbidus]MBP1326135.1 molybdopterin-guanine dinucleotide biosynthesis protein A [Leucobacter exalbidus]